MTNKKVRNLFIILVFLSLLILIFNDNIDYSMTRAFFRTPIKPFIRTIDFISETNGKIIASEMLTIYLAEEMLKKNKLKALDYENRLLRQMLDFNTTVSYRLIPSEVIGGNQSDESKLIINRGTKHGITEGMAVFFLKGIIGKIVECANAYSVVETHSNMNFKVGVCDKDRKYFMIAYFYAKGSLKVENIQYDVKLEEGDTLFTSGFGNIYPPDIPVGTIEKTVRSEDGEWFYLLSPLENLGALRFVFAAEKRIDVLPAIFSEHKMDTLGEIGWYMIYRRQR
ncbi:MAG: rod shape-determining protein MreC [bacterium]